MLDYFNIEDVLFLDIETVPQFYNYDLLTPKLKELWDKKSKYFRKEEQTASEVYQRAGIYAEFGKIVCISVGFIKALNSKNIIRIKSFYGDNEKELLTGFGELLEESFNKPEHLLCAHNGKEFDFPYLARRMLINGVKLPKKLDIAGKKPWEVAHLDTMELWKFGDYKNYTSLNLLTTIFKIPTPKDDIDGSMVAEVYWEDKDIERIVTYCQKDVLAVAQLLLRYKALDIIPPENVRIIS